jgi:hypothetical protein
MVSSVRTFPIYHSTLWLGVSVALLTAGCSADIARFSTASLSDGATAERSSYAGGQ